MMSINLKVKAFSVASKRHTEAKNNVANLRAKLYEAEEVFSKAEQERNRTQRELLEEAKLT